MGNILTPNSYLLLETLKSLEILTKWSFKDSKFISQKHFHSIFVSPLYLRFYLSDTQLQKHFFIIREKFSYQGHLMVNVMEILACIITYSSCLVQEKVQMAFEVFDFDKDNTITCNEMTIMCLSFMRGIAVMTGSTILPDSYCEELAKEAFIHADSYPDGEITLDELQSWVMGNQVLVQLFSNKTSTIPEIKQRKSILQTHGFELIDKKTGFPLVKYRKVKVLHSPTKTKSIKKSLFNPHISLNYKQDYKQHNNSTQRRLRKPTHKLSFKITKKKYLKNRYASLDSNQYKLVSGESCEEKVLQLKKLFNSYDLNKDGFVSLSELKKALRDKMNLHGVQELFSEYDRDADGQLSLDEFMSMFLPKNIPISKITIR